MENDGSDGSASSSSDEEEIVAPRRKRRRYVKTNYIDSPILLSFTNRELKTLSDEDKAHLKDSGRAFTRFVEAFQPIEKILSVGFTRNKDNPMSKKYVSYLVYRDICNS